MADPFTYEQDVAPLRGTYFSGYGADGRQRTGTERRALMSAFDRNVAPALQAASVARLASQREQLNDVYMQEQRLQLKQQKRQFRQEREDAEQIPQTLADLTPLLDPNADIEERQRIFTQSAVKNATLFRNPAVASIYNLVGTSLHNQRQELADKRRAEEQRQTELDRSVLGAVEVGDFDSVAAWNEATGGRYESWLAPAKARQGTGIAAARAKQQEERDKEDRDSIADRLAKEAEIARASRIHLSKRLDDIHTRAMPKDEFGVAVPGADVPFALHPTDRDELLRAAAQLLPPNIDPSDLPDKELYGLVRGRVEGDIVSPATRSPIIINTWNPRTDK